MLGKVLQVTLIILFFTMCALTVLRIDAGRSGTLHSKFQEFGITLPGHTSNR